MGDFDPIALYQAPLWAQWLPFVGLVAVCALLLTAGWLAVRRFGRAPSPMLCVAGVMLVLPLCVGGFYIWVSAAVTVVLAGMLTALAHTQGKLILRWNEGMMVCTLLPLAYLVVALWGVDTGLSVMGFAKYLPVPLFYVLLMQTTPQQRDRVLGWLPLGGVGMVLVTGVLQFIPALQPWLQVNHRLAGLFQYPNSFAAYLLCMAVLLLKSTFSTRVRLACLVVLAAGIALSGSRTTILIALVIGVILLVMQLRQRGSIKHLAIPVAALVGVAALAGIYFFTVGGNAFERLLVNPLTSSSLLGRILYAKDALMASLSHPFGIGYGGYFYAQGSFQTGVYSVQYVHNELLQLILEIGWIPALAVVFCLVRAWLRSDGVCRLALAALGLHSLMDFDLQFLSLILLLMLCAHAGVDRPDTKLFRRPHPRVRLALVLSGAALSVALAVADTSYYMKRPDVTLQLYPAHTQSKMYFLVQQDQAQGLSTLADAIIATNHSVSLAYSAKANAAMAQGDGTSVILHKQTAISLNPYEIAEYEDYAKKLVQLIQLYQQQGMTDSATFCHQRLQEIPQMLQQVEDQTSSLAWRLVETPQLGLTPQLQEYLMQGS